MMLTVTTKDEKTRSKTLLPALEHQCRCFSMAELNSATDNFDEKWCIGQGGFGKVYKGMSTDDPKNIYAIKRLHSMSNQGATEFWVEVEMLSRLRHCNIVPLIGYCDERREMALVYEYMQNGTLYDCLHKKDTVLTWSQRLQICIGAARGLDYLHTGTGTKQGIIHRDIKSSNILLDQDYDAKIADFGLAKVGPINQTRTHVSTEVKGSFGYMDPSYINSCKLTRKSDVYAFGFVLLEVLCGKPALDKSLDDGLAIWAEGLIKQGKVRQIIDPRLRGRISKRSLKEFSGIAVQCLASRTKRPTMSEVLGSLYRALSFQKRKASPNQGWITITNVWALLTHKGPFKLRSWRADESKEINDNTMINENVSVTVPPIVTKHVYQREALDGQDENQSKSNIGNTSYLIPQINALSSNSLKGGGASRLNLPHVFMLEAVPTPEVENKASHTRNPANDSDNIVADQVDAEWVEQYEPGVYVTLMVLRDGTKDIRRIRFSSRRFCKHEAVIWWSEYHEEVCERFGVSRFAVS